MGEGSVSTPLKIVFATLGGALLLLLVFFSARVVGYYRAIQRGDLSSLPQFEARLTKGNFSESGASGDASRVERADSPALGPENAPLTVTVFADFECPYSKEAFPAERAALSGDPNVRFVFRHFPLQEIHDQARPAAAAAYCAGRQGKFWPLHDKLFQNAPNISPSEVRFYAEQIGVNLAEYDACLKDPTTDASLARDLADGRAAGVRGTPTFFFNGRKVEGAIPLSILKQLVTSFTK